MGVVEDFNIYILWGHNSIPAAASAAVKSLQSCLTLCNPIDRSLPGSLIDMMFVFKYLKCYLGLS